MITSFRLLGSAAVLGLGVLAPNVLTIPAAVADTSADATRGTAGESGEEGSGTSLCRPISLTGGSLVAQCSAGPNGASADGSESATAAGDDEG
ncbi:hypothetical protein OU415_10470 [Saccharopolyspora sp. WRP15-2]|uniref:Small secreted domain DUF320 n=1 Tax=Saccharopolyspora oryzae TaxID=2997343 RepID=A0ABT4UXN9_9PSEU|nr:hypothetical protein [Saccharopolyspora oryzae]MDA3625862.1 hypothetical protein [Saccharopolyspora oryzae]